MRTVSRAAALISSVAVVAFSGCGAEAAPDYRVWAADQNQDAIFVLAPDGELLERMDLAAVGAERPHTIHPDPSGALILSANTVSNQASIHSSTDGEILAVVAAVGKLPHAVQPHPDDPDRAFVSNIGPREEEDGTADRGETITEIRRAGDGDWEVSRTLDLVGAPALADEEIYPSRRPVLVGFSADGGTMLVTLFDGGVAAVDLEAWEVTRGWGPEEVIRHATVVVPSPDREELYVTAGGETESWLYVFDVTGEPELVASHDLADWGRDAHGAAVNRHGEELWVTHRASGTLTIHPLGSLQEPHEPESLELAGETPDLVEISPDGQRAFVTLRGPDPAPTIPFPLTGQTPGVAIVDVPARQLVDVVPLGDPEHSDFHGLAIVQETEL